MTDSDPTSDNELEVPAPAQEKIQLTVPMMGVVDEERMRDAGTKGTTDSLRVLGQDSGEEEDGRDDDSRTEAHVRSTAAKIGKHYAHEAPVSTNPDKSSERTDDGHVNSAAYAVTSRFLHSGHDERPPHVSEGREGPRGLESKMCSGVPAAPLPNPQSEICNPQSSGPRGVTLDLAALRQGQEPAALLPNPQSEICNPQSSGPRGLKPTAPPPNPQSAIRNPQSSGPRRRSGSLFGRPHPAAPRRGARSRSVDLDYHHPLEDVLGTWPMRKLLGFVSKSRAGGGTLIEDIIRSYGNPDAPLAKRIRYWPFHKFIDRMRGSVTRETFRRRVGEHVSTLRGLVVTARSVAEFGLTLPQRFCAPLFTVWNFTNRCNLRCRHCYQDAERGGMTDELTLDEKLDLVDQMAEQYVPMIAFAGGEPTLSRDLLPVLKRCRHHGIHASIATNGASITRPYAARLAEVGVKYVEISLDSVDPAKHDAFRGRPGMWERSVAGMRNVVAQEGLRLGVAMCVHQGNFDEVERMLQFAVDIGASCLAHFNFIPVGRGLEMIGEDLNPRQREWLLETLNEWMQSGRIGVISTAPQFGRICIARAPVEGLQSCSHAGSGGGEKARVIAKYLGGCGAGRTYVCIEPDGAITPCVYMPQRVLGNIRRRPFKEIFRENAFWDVLCDRDRRTGHCEVCAFRHYCGGCRARADAYCGALNGEDPGCIFNEKHWEDLVRRGAAADGAARTVTAACAAGETGGPGGGMGEKRPLECRTAG